MIFIPLEKLLQKLCPDQRIESAHDVFINVEMFIPRALRIPVGLLLLFPFMPARVVITNKTYFIDRRLESAIYSIILTPLAVAFLLLLESSKSFSFNGMLLYFFISIAASLFGAWLTMHSGGSILMIPRKSITQETKNSDGLTIKGEIMPPTWISLDALGKEKKAKIPGFIIGGFWRYAFSHGVLTIPTKFYFSFKFRDKRGRSVSLNLRNFYLFVVGLSVILGIIISLLFWFIK